MTEEGQEREIIFDEASLSDLNAVAQQLFSSGAQPWEAGYQRVLARPEIHWGRMALCCLLPLVGAAALFLLGRCVMPWPAALAVALAALAVYTAVRLKDAIIALVELYQHFAPDAIRNKCRFEPSCSQYMIAAVRKYGACRGLCKGVDRLCRCNVNNGGYDEP